MRGPAGVLIATRTGMHLLLDSRYREAMQRLQDGAGACPDLRLVEVPSSYDEAMLSCLEGLGVAVVGFEAGHVTVAAHAFWEIARRDRLSGVELRPTNRVVESARVVKDGVEIDTLRDAAQRLGQVAEQAMGELKAGLSERQFAGVIDSCLRAAGYERPSFATIVASGPNSALPHHHPGDRILAAGDLLVLDFGGVLDRILLGLDPDRGHWFALGGCPAAARGRGGCAARRNRCRSSRHRPLQRRHRRAICAPGEGLRGGIRTRNWPRAGSRGARGAQGGAPAAGRVASAARTRHGLYGRARRVPARVWRRANRRRRARNGGRLRGADHGSS